MTSFKRYAAELAGTYCLVFAGTGAIVVNQIHGEVTHVGIALTFGMIVSAMIYAFGETSGAHINPAVTIAFWIGRRFQSQHVLPYIVAQFLGAILASLSIRLLFPDVDSWGTTNPAGSVAQTFLLEFILTAMLMTVILRVSAGSKETGIMAGIAIGMTVGLEAMFGGPVSGASMNPARSLGPALVSLDLQHLWVYLISTTAGASFAVATDSLFNSEEIKSEPQVESAKPSTS